VVTICFLKRCTKKCLTTTGHFSRWWSEKHLAATKCFLVKTIDGQGWLLLMIGTLHHWWRRLRKVLWRAQYVSKIWTWNMVPHFKSNCWLVRLLVTTLALGSRPRQGVARLQAKRKPGSARKCEGIDPHTPKGTPLWELESQWTPECSENDCRGQNPMDWKVLYIIGKLLKLRCLKWARITHLDI
jgi:hypothetical protein